MQPSLEHFNNVSVETFHIKEIDIVNDRNRVLSEIENNGGITCKELANKWGCSPNDISGRFTELHKMGFIEPDGKKYIPNYKGRMYPHTIWKVRII